MHSDLSFHFAQKSFCLQSQILREKEGRDGVLERKIESDTYTDTEALRERSGEGSGSDRKALFIQMLKRYCSLHDIWTRVRVPHSKSTLHIVLLLIAVTLINTTDELYMATQHPHLCVVFIPFNILIKFNNNLYRTCTLTDSYLYATRV